MKLETLLSYSDRCQALMAATLAGHDELLHREFATTSSFNSIAKLLAHSIAAEERWLRIRLGGETIAVMYEKRAAATLDGLIADARAMRQQTWAFVQTQTPETLAHERQLDLGGTLLTLTVEGILFHVLNHENWHRAQIVMALQQFGIDPPNFDYCLLAA